MVGYSKRLVNEFSWSFSRHSTLEECPKKYWYVYYGAWEGWEWFRKNRPNHANVLSGYLYAMKNMQSLAMYVGTVVHEAIEKTIHDFRQQGKLTSLDDVLKRGKDHFLNGIKDAKDKKWLTSPKKFTLLTELYYQDLYLDDSKVNQSLEKIERSLTNWYNSPIIQAMLTSQKTDFLGVEELDCFYLDGIYKIWVVIDLALHWNKEQVVLIDWKTGVERSENLSQLYTYALYAQQKWKSALENIVLTPFYLDSNTYYKVGCNQEKSITQHDLDDITSFMRSSCKIMEDKLEGNISDNKAFVENFGYTEDRRRCRTCPFKELCETVDYKDLTIENLIEDASNLI